VSTQTNTGEPGATPTGTAPLLDVAGLHISFDGLRAVDDVSFSVSDGEVFGIIGPNGAGKTTLLNAVSGLLPLQDGIIKIAGTQVNRLRPDRITALGVGRTFQAAEVFDEFEVLDYMLLGRFGARPKSLTAAALRLPVARRPERRDRAEATALLERFGVAAVRHQPLRGLPYGSRKLIDLLRALFGQPRLLLLDEPTSGTASDDRVLLREALAEAAAEGVTVVLVDHDVQFVSNACNRVLVMNFGKTLGIGSPAEVLARPDVQAAYVGLE
jgi:branched-chain amino acid transport system ATP-binding protein